VPLIYATRTISCTYDGIREQTGAIESPGSSFAYVYDSAGNRISVRVNRMLKRRCRRCDADCADEHGKTRHQARQ
jgi:YD repeat-containing protein